MLENNTKNMQEELKRERKFGTKMAFIPGLKKY